MKTHYLKQEDQRCDGRIIADPKDELCTRRKDCQRYIAAMTDPSNKMAAWVVPVRNCARFVAMGRMEKLG